MKKYIAHLILNSAFLILHSFCFGQQYKIDSLLKVLKTSKEDTSKLLTFMSLSNEYIFIGKFDSALYYANVSLNIGKKLNNLSEIAYAYNLIGTIYDYQGNYDKALEIFYSSLKLVEKLGDQEKIAIAYQSIATVFFEEGKKDKALENYLISMEIIKKIGNKILLSSCYNNIGILYSDQGKHDKALEYHFAALKIRQEMSNKREIARSYNNIGAEYYYQEKYDMALENLFLSLKLKEELGDQQGIAMLHNNIGDAYLKQNKIEEARKQSLISLNISKEIGSKDDIKEAYKMLSLCDSAAGNWRDAYRYHKLYKQLNDSIFYKESSDKIAEMNVRFESEKKEAQISLLEKEKEKENAVSVAESKKQKAILIAVVSGLFLVIVFSVFMFNRWRITKKQKKIIEIQKIEVEQQKDLVEEKNHEISSSISYAKRIQSSFLTSETYIKRHLSDYFILYKPRDVVSGDFYWMHQQGKYFYFCVADCTGHGIPGAFMSLIGMGILNEIANSKQISDTNNMLDELRRIIILALNPEGALEEGKDGMDMILGRLNLTSKELQYSAANNSFYVCRKGELMEYKPDKMPVGKFGDYEKPFSKHTIQLEDDDIIYAITDGYADQFGGPKGKKFKYKQLEDILISNSNQPMHLQSEILNKKLNDWKADLEQVDDITIVGIRL